MSNLDVRKVKESFARLFVIATQNEVNLKAFTKALERSVFANILEANRYDDYFNSSLENIFFDITRRRIDKDESFGIYNDAYWCGYSYFEIQRRLKKSFSFLFLKLPLSKMMDIYPVFHEMDFSSLFQFFKEEDQKKTILRALCEEKKRSIRELSYATGINAATLSKYNASDESLFRGSFENIYKIAKHFDVPLALFCRTVE